MALLLMLHIRVIVSRSLWALKMAVWVFSLLQHSDSDVGSIHLHIYLLTQGKHFSRSFKTTMIHFSFTLVSLFFNLSNDTIFLQPESVPSCCCGSPNWTKPVRSRTYRWWSVHSWTTRIGSEMGHLSSAWKWCRPQCRLWCSWFRATPKVTALCLRVGLFHLGP